MAEFLAREAAPGNLGPKPPPHDDWEAFKGRPLRDYLRSLASTSNPQYFMPKFKEGGRLGCLAFPAAPGMPALDSAALRAAGYTSPDKKITEKTKPPPPKRGPVASGGEHGKHGGGGAKGAQGGGLRASKDGGGGRHLNDASPDSEALARLASFAAGREVMALEGPWLDAKVVHLAAWPNEGYRMLMHFYTLLFFQDEGMDRRMKVC